MNDKCAHKTCSNLVKRKGKKYCSSKCYNDAKSVWAMMPCGFCGKEFEGVPGKSKYCTKACSNSATKRSRVTLTCDGCGVSFEVVAGRGDDARFCTYECFASHRRGGQSIEVELTCEGCQEKFMKPFIYRATRFCSRSCATTGERNSSYGKSGTEHPTYGSPKWNVGLTKLTDERLAAVGRKISEVISDKIIAGEWNHQPGFNSGHFTSAKSGRTMYYRSSYELRAMEILEADPDVRAFKAEPFSIIYTGLDGLQHRYHPDILVEMVDGSQRLIEVKPSSLVNEATNVIKKHAGQRFCADNGLTLEVWTETTLANHDRIVHGAFGSHDASCVGEPT